LSMAEHSELMRRVNEAQAVVLSRLQDYFSDVEIPVAELAPLRREVDALLGSGHVTPELTVLLKGLQQVIMRAIAENKAVVAIAD